jgi:hypothetical protein
MEILNKNVSLLSNFELYALLKQTKEEIGAKLVKKKLQKNLDHNNSNLNQSLDIDIDRNLPTIIYQSLSYLEKTPAALQSSEVISEFLAKCEEKKKDFNLTQPEIIQIVNLRPSTAPELQVLIQDSEERFTIEQMDELLEFISQNLPSNNIQNTDEQIDD